RQQSIHLGVNGAAEFKKAADTGLSNFLLDLNASIGRCFFEFLNVLQKFVNNLVLLRGVSAKSILHVWKKRTPCIFSISFSRFAVDATAGLWNLVSASRQHVSLPI